MSRTITFNDFQKFQLFENLSQDDLKKILPYFKFEKVKSNEIIYQNADVARHFILVLSGSIKISRLSKDGKEQIIRTILPKQFTGELALFEGIRKAYAIALEESEIISIEHDSFKTLLRNYPELSLQMIKILSERLHLSEAQTSLLSMNTSKERLWIYLNEHSTIKNDKKIFQFKQTKRFTASYLGMSSETLSRMLHQLEEDNKITQINAETIELNF